MGLYSQQGLGFMICLQDFKDNQSKRIVIGDVENPMGGDELWLSRKPFNKISEYGKSISQVLRKRSVLIAKSTESTSPCCWKPTWFPYPPDFLSLDLVSWG